MDNYSLSFGYKKIKLNAGWEGRGGGIGKALDMCCACICFHWEVDLYQSMYGICTLTLECRKCEQKMFDCQKQNNEDKSDKIKLLWK